MADLVFPRLQRLAVRGFELYPGVEGQGFDHPFPPGINVIVGINGVGKTTLLNVIFRMLVGPYDPAKADQKLPGRKQASMMREKHFDFFRKRASDEASNAIATASFLFGGRSVEITRSLHDLSLEEYKLDGRSHLPGVDGAEALDEELMDKLCALMGLELQLAPSEDELPPHRYDYDFVVRNLVFFLEEKTPLIWNPDGQFVILRILLVESELSGRIAKDRNALLRADSLYRNHVWQHNKLAVDLRKRLNDLQRATFSEEAERLELIITRIQGLEEEKEDLAADREAIAGDLERIENELLVARSELFDAETVLRNVEETYFHGTFVYARPPGDLVVQAISSHEGCLVCGTSDQVVYERARQRLEAHHCPVCDSAMPRPEDVADLQGVRLEELRAAERRGSDLRQRVEGLERLEKRKRDDYQRVLNEMKRNGTELFAAQARRQLLEAGEMLEAETLALKAQLEESERKRLVLKADLDAAIDRHEQAVGEARGDIERFSDRIVEEFNKYAAAFMVDTCNLRYRPNRRAKVAQSDNPIDWPAFEVEFASGVDGRPTPRTDAHEVSESQKEFIDLAFRMALLKVAANGRPSMLAIETPEASLDTYFVERAGELLRQYAQDAEGNVLLVSSNLTKEDMISALLGVNEGGTPESRQAQVLNLLAQARKTKAYETHKEQYDKAFRKAVGLPDPKPVVGEGTEPA